MQDEGRHTRNSQNMDMAFVPAPALAANVRGARARCRRRPRMAIEAPVKEDVRTRLDRLFSLGDASGAGSATETAGVEARVDPGKHYKVLLFNDEGNSKDYVTRVLLMVVPGLTQEGAWAIMSKAHKDGQAVVGIWIFEISEGYCEMLRSNGLRSAIEEV